jgi:hypothetical protein
MTAAFEVRCLGPVAAEILGHDGEADVIAVFERCFYLAAPNGIICIGNDDLGPGPLNVLLAQDEAAQLWTRLGVTREAKGRVDRHRLAVGDEFIVHTGGAPVWHPAPWPPVNAALIATSVAKARAIAAPLCPDEGLSRVVISPDAKPADRTADAAQPVLREFARALSAALPNGALSPQLLRAATLLVGLGPGLTPSGDDVLGGVFLTLSALGATALREALWAALEPELDLLTVEISAAHLAASADGLCAEAMHRALNAILTGDIAALPGCVATLRHFGHSSGFDTLAGMVLTLEASLSRLS